MSANVGHGDFLSQKFERDNYEEGKGAIEEPMNQWSNEKMETD
jgi:hypothetical protein